MCRPNERSLPPSGVSMAQHTAFYFDVGALSLMMPQAALLAVEGPKHHTLHYVFFFYKYALMQLAQIIALRCVVLFYLLSFICVF